MSDFRDNQLKKVTILDVLSISLFHNNPNRLKIDKTSKLVTLGQNLDVLFLFLIQTNLYIKMKKALEILRRKGKIS